MNSKIGDAAPTYAEQGRLGFSVTAPLNRAAAQINATPEDIARAEAAQIDGLRVKPARPLRIHTLGDCKTKARNGSGAGASAPNVRGGATRV